MSNFFKKTIKNSNNTQKKWEDTKEEIEVISKKCPQCGAARPKDTNLTTCDYCGYKFMDIGVVIKTDK